MFHLVSLIVIKNRNRNTRCSVDSWMALQSWRIDEAGVESNLSGPVYQLLRTE